MQAPGLGKGACMAIRLGDCLTTMSRCMEENSVDAIVTDPPYGLKFMGKGWDHGLPGVDFWEAAFRVLKPSHYLLAFGGTRTWHRLACAIEDAGFEIRDTLMWLYGSGFPKGTACLKPAWEPIILARKPGPKRALGIEECRVGTKRDVPASLSKNKFPNGFGPMRSGVATERDLDPNMGRWPANLILECTCEETREGTVKGTIRQPTGKAVYPTDGPAVKWNKNSVVDNTVRGYGSEPVRIHTDLNCPCAMLDGQTGTLTSGNLLPGHKRGDGPNVPYGGGGIVTGTYGGDSGGASRFFYTAKASRKERNAGCEGMPARTVNHYGQNVTNGSGELQNGDGFVTPTTNHHPTVKPLALMRWLVKLVAYPGDTVLDPFMGSGTTGVACVMEGRKFLGIEQDAEYIKIAQARIAHARQQEAAKVAVP